MYNENVYAQAHDILNQATRVGFSAKRYQDMVRKVTGIRRAHPNENEAVSKASSWLWENLSVQMLTDLCSSAEHLQAVYARNPESWAPGMQIPADTREFLSRCAVSVLHVNTEINGSHPIINHAYQDVLTEKGMTGLRNATTKQIVKAVDQLYFARSERAVTLSYDLSQPTPADFDQRIVKTAMPMIYAVRTKLEFPSSVPVRYRTLFESRRYMLLDILAVLQEGPSLLDPLYDLVMSVTNHMQATGQLTLAKTLQYGKILGYLECFAIMAKARGESCRKIMSAEGNDSGVKSLVIASVMDYRRHLPIIKREIIALVLDMVLAGQEEELLPEISARCKQLQVPESPRYFNKPSPLPANPTAASQ